MIGPGRLHGARRRWRSRRSFWEARGGGDDPRPRPHRRQRSIGQRRGAPGRSLAGGALADMHLAQIAFGSNRALHARSLTAPAALQRAFVRTPVSWRAIERGYKGRVDPNAVCSKKRPPAALSLARTGGYEDWLGILGGEAL